MTGRELIDLCLTWPDAYEDYPFGDEWAVLRHLSLIHISEPTRP